MRLGLILVLGLLSGCITSSETTNSGLKTTRTSFLFIPVSKSVTQTQHRAPQTVTKNQQSTASAE